MLFDDRLATVLRSGAASEAALRTQFRQLLDLLGSMDPDSDESPMVEAAYSRLQDLAEELPAAVQAAILREPGLRLRNVRLLHQLAQAEPQAAASALASAHLAESEWLDLIPILPITARGFLRHRRDLPPRASRMLQQLGVRDLVLPLPPGHGGLASAGPILSAAPPPAEAALTADADSGIGALVRRIEAFRRSRGDEDGRDATGASAEEQGLGRERDAARGIDFETDEQGSIAWADPEFAPLLVGLSFGDPDAGALAALERSALQAMDRHLPLHSDRVTLSGAEPLAGDWRLSAVPLFAEGSGSFTGYRGRLRRPAARPSAPIPRHDPADTLRQILHELRTPVNAIQGFAEIIQQQMFGPVPNEYRAHAAGIAVDAARLLASFEELDRLARLESGALELEEGEADLRSAIGRNLQRLEAVLRPRSARIELSVSGSPFAVAMDEAEAARLSWRLLALLAAALAPGEMIGLALSGDEHGVTLRADLPSGLMDEDELTLAPTAAQPRAVSASTFGSGFAYRLARAEALAAGGSLARTEDELVLQLPALTARPAHHSVEGRGNGSHTAMP